MSLSLPKNPRILICRLSHIGDCILTLPMVDHLRTTFPKSWIAWAVESPTDQLLRDHSQVDQLIKIPKRWLKSPKAIVQVRRELRSHSFDLALDPQSLTKSSMLAWLSGAKQRVGFSGQHGRELSTWQNNVKVTPTTTHLVDRSLELLKPLGIEISNAKFRLPIRDTANCYVDQFLTERALLDSPFMVLNPGASWPSKRWNNQRFGQVAKDIHDRTGISTLVTWAGDAESQMATEVCQASDGAAIMAPKTDLQQLAVILQRAHLFLGCDTGPLHLAAAMGTTCVGLYGPTRPEDSGAYGARHFAIQEQFHAGSSRERRTANNDAMMKITVKKVTGVCCQALASVRLAEANEAEINVHTTRNREAA